MSGFSIDRGVPIPTSVGRGSKESRYPFSDMAVGDSIRLDDEKALQAARNAAYLYKQKNPEFGYGACVEDNGGRLWRMDP